jgi:hypothetical protein
MAKKKKFVIMAGDDGAVLVLINEGKVEKRLFTKSASLSDRREFNSVLLKYPDVPVRLTIDIMEQSYTKQSLPAVSSLAISKLVKKRLDRDFAASDLKGAVLLGRDSEGRKDWIYLFASCPLTSNISEWIDYLMTLPNRFEGIYMLPLEMENLVRSINKKLLKPKEEAPLWQFLVTSNKTGGYRQIVLYKNKVIFTRLIRTGKDTIVEIVAGNIEQEILNTIDYIRRLGFSDDDEISVTAVLPKDIKKSMEEVKVGGKEISIYTPFELANVLELKDVASEDDKFSDVVLAANMINVKPILTLDNPQMKSINSLLVFSKVVNTLTFILIPGLSIYAGYLAYSIISSGSDIKELESKKINIEKKWRGAQKSDEYDLDEANKITNVYKLHNVLKRSSDPLRMIETVIAPNTKYIYSESFSWSYSEVAGSGSDIKMQENSKFELKYTDLGNSIEDLYRNFDRFSRRVESLSSKSGYESNLTELPNVVTFDANRQPIAVTLTLKTDDKNN